MDLCPKCSTPTEMGYGLAGGGIGPYTYCPKCEMVIQKWQEEDSNDGSRTEKTQDRPE